MKEPDEKAAQNAVEYGITIFHALGKQTENITEAMLVTSALLQALGEKFPDLIERYEYHLKEGRKVSPLSADSRQLVEQFERIEKQLRELIAKRN